MKFPRRHCERSEAIQNISVEAAWIASSQELLAMTESRARAPPSLHKTKSFARCVHGPFVAQWQREHAVEIRARMFGVGHHHVEESAVDQGELAFRIEPDRLVVVGERAIVLSDVPKQTGATAVGLRIPRP